jgi:hypothetical protein
MTPEPTVRSRLREIVEGAVRDLPTPEETLKAEAKRRFPHQSKVDLTARAGIPIPISGLWPPEGDRVGPEDLGPDRDGDRALRGAGPARPRASAGGDGTGAGDAAPVWARGHAVAQPEGDTDPGQRRDQVRLPLA